MQAQICNPNSRHRIYTMLRVMYRIRTSIRVALVVRLIAITTVWTTAGSKAVRRRNVDRPRDAPEAYILIAA